MPAANPEILAGILDKRVTLLEPVYNEHQDEITGWRLVTDVWASVTPNFGQEQDEASRTVSVNRLAIVIRYRSDIDARWRLRDGRHTYEIDALFDVQRRGSQLQLHCKEIQ